MRLDAVPAAEDARQAECTCTASYYNMQWLHRGTCSITGIHVHIQNAYTEHCPLQTPL